MLLKKYFIWSFFISLTLVSAYAGENKSSNDVIFNEAPTSGWTQVLLGLVDYGAYHGLSQYQPEHMRFLRNAELELDNAKNLSTSVAERNKLVESLEELQSKLDLIDESDRSVAQDRRLERLPEEISAAKSQRIVSAAEKSAAIEKASQAVNEARASSLAANKTFGNRAVKSVVFIGKTVFILDLLGRIYVWNALDANPTLTPVGTFTWHHAKKMLEAKDKKTSQAVPSATAPRADFTPETSTSSSAM